MELNPIVIIGTGPEARIALDIFNENGVLAYGFITHDEEKVRSDLNDISVFGTLEDEDVIRVLKDSKVDYMVAVGEIDRRKEMQTTAAGLTGRPAVNALHQKATVSPYAKTGVGNLFHSGVCIGPNATVGDCNMLHANVTVDPDAKVGHFCTFGSGARIAGNVVIEDEVFVGTGAVIFPGVKVGKGAIIGAGSVVLAEVKAGAKVFGNPAKAY